MINKECKGIRFVKHEGHHDCYDPVVFPSGLMELDGKYLVDNGHHVYEVEKATVRSFSWYEICHNCGHEVDEAGLCDNCSSEDEA